MNRITDEAKRKLVDRRKGIERLYRENKAEEQALSEVDANSRERAEGRVTVDLLDRLSGSERREIAEIDAALARIERGTFGRCRDCSGAIGRQRLLAIPETPYCVECAEQIAHAG